MTEVSISIERMNKINVISIFAARCVPGNEELGNAKIAKNWQRNVH